MDGGKNLAFGLVELSLNKYLKHLAIYLLIYCMVGLTLEQILISPTGYQIF
jgi:hypothetical protein